MAIAMWGVPASELPSASHTVANTVVTAGASQNPCLGLAGHLKTRSSTRVSTKVVAALRNS